MRDRANFEPPPSLSADFSMKKNIFDFFQKFFESKFPNLNAGFDRLGIHSWSEERHQLEEKKRRKCLIPWFFWNRHHI